MLEVVLSQRAAMASCVQAQQKAAPGSHGRLVMRWSISPQKAQPPVSVPFVY